MFFVLKASKADKEALEGGDINSILFASAGLGGGKQMIKPPQEKLTLDF